MNYFIIVVISVLLGGISTSYLIGKYVYKKDIRQIGSGNPGATNALRTFGKKIGLLTLIIDALKCSLAVYIGFKLSGINGESIALATAVLSHMYPYSANFKGGKGIASSIGGLLVINYKMGLLLLIGIFFVIVLLTRYVSLGSICAAVACPFAVILFYGFSAPYLLVSSIVISVFVIYRHSKNIKRLLKKQESKIF